MLLPGDLRVVCRVVTTIGRILFHWIMHTLDHAAIDRESAQGGEKTFRGTIRRIDPLGVAPFSDDVTMANDDPVGLAAHLRQWPKHAAKRLDLRGKVPRDRAGLCLRISDRLLKQRAVHPNF